MEAGAAVAVEVQVAAEMEVAAEVAAKLKVIAKMNRLGENGAIMEIVTFTLVTQTLMSHMDINIERVNVRLNQLMTTW